MLEIHQIEVKSAAKRHGIYLSFRIFQFLYGFCNDLVTELAVTLRKMLWDGNNLSTEGNSLAKLLRLHL